MAKMMEDTPAKVAEGVHIELRVELTADYLWTASQHITETFT